MPIATSAMKNLLSDAYKAAATHGSLHTADPGTTGTSEVTGGSPAYARKALTWGASSNGVTTSSAVFDVGSGITPSWAGVWGALSAGTFYDKADIVDQTFASQGTLTVNFTYTQT